LAHEQRLALSQRNFVSMASHEFRTPMTVIDGHARRLDKTKDTVAPAEIGERAGKIRSAVLRMTQLIENLLNSSRLIDGGAGLYLNVAPMDMRALLEEVCQLHREMVPGLQLTQHFAATPVPMVGDAKLLFQALSNLLSNAVKYSPAGGVIEVTMESSVDEVAVSVSDHGIGIPASDMAHLFERYHRGSNVSGIVGTGVGLYLAKTALDLHYGVVEVQSREGDGSRFTVRLPRAALTVDKSPAAAAPLMADV
jgi:two-component system, OmpR family, sensor kinase